MIFYDFVSSGASLSAEEENNKKSKEFSKYFFAFFFFFKEIFSKNQEKNISLLKSNKHLQIEKKLCKYTF